MEVREYVAFEGTTLICRGPLRDVARAAKHALDADADARIQVIDASSSDPVELDLRGTVDDVLGRLPAEEPAAEPATEPSPAVENPEARRAPGRPRLGVVAREVTLLPRHWEWLAAQPGGASVTLRKLVERARREGAEDERRRAARESAYRFMTTLAGDEAGYEEATRALFAGDEARFRDCTESWPADVGAHARELSSRAASPARGDLEDAR